MRRHAPQPDSRIRKFDHLVKIAMLAGVSPALDMADQNAR